jgi:phthalate 4,5-dioxygenase oxygenase subunit
MITRAENERLTRVTGDVSLGNMLRENYWIPVARSQGIALRSAPERLRILGRDLVIFRSNSGQIGLLDEYCPHRRASLALAQVEGDSLRCIYHGWRMDCSGRVVEVPSEGARSEQFAARVKVHRYRVAEAGGLVWAFFGQKDTPDMPPLPFLTVPEESRWFCRMKVNCNWLQGFEGALDSVHLNWLHQGWAEGDRRQPLISSPVYETERTAYGLRTAAIRESGAEAHFRVAEFVAPFFALSASRQPSIPSDFSVFISVPVDDETHLLLYGRFPMCKAFSV